MSEGGILCVCLFLISIAGGDYAKHFDGTFDDSLLPLVILRKANPGTLGQAADGLRARTLTRRKSGPGGKFYQIKPIQTPQTTRDRAGSCAAGE